MKPNQDEFNTFLHLCVLGNTTTNDNSAFQKYPSLSVSKVQPEPEPMEYIFVEELPETRIKQDIETNNIVLTHNQMADMNERNNRTTTVLNSPRKLSKIVQKCRTPVKILPKTPIVSPKVTPTRNPFITRKISSPIKIFSTPSKNALYDVNAIEKFSTAWRCTICKKIISTKKVALEHLKTFHPKRNTN